MGQRPVARVTLVGEEGDERARDPCHLAWERKAERRNGGVGGNEALGTSEGGPCIGGINAVESCG